MLLINPPTGKKIGELRGEEEILQLYCCQSSAESCGKKMYPALHLCLNSTHIYSITFIQYIHFSPFAEVPLLLIAGHNLPGLPMRESNSGLPYSNSTHSYLS